MNYRNNNNHESMEFNKKKENWKKYACYLSQWYNDDFTYRILCSSNNNQTTGFISLFSFNCYY